ncbi:hypothetical protein [Lutibacter sp.]|uniref:hypothetical protein n=1 Tax=Lutibacter sp. TaxID=1925666 RepID=UPI0025B84BCB|nr:hypothetical protein [Lutibacter sp.]MCF6168043.1 hypothetical protein [Lutibacter sp.]
MEEAELKKIKGKIKFVENFADYNVEITEIMPDLKVKIVEHLFNREGEWQIVDSMPDIKIKIVENFGDFSIQFVNNFPGIV